MIGSTIHTHYNTYILNVYYLSVTSIFKQKFIHTLVVQVDLSAESGRHSAADALHARAHHLLCAGQEGSCGARYLHQVRYYIRRYFKYTYIRLIRLFLPSVLQENLNSYVQYGRKIFLYLTDCIKQTNKNPEKSVKLRVKLPPYLGRIACRCSYTVSHRRREPTRWITIYCTYTY